MALGENGTRPQQDASGAGVISAAGGLAGWGIVAAAFAAMAALLAAQLRTEGYGASTALALGGLAIAQPGYLPEAGAVHTALLALATCTIGVCAVALAKEQSVRRIILLGGSLAGAQLVDLPDGIAAALMLPAVLRLPRSRAELERMIGLYVLLLFLPALVLLGRFYFAWLGQSDIPHWDAPSPAASDRAAFAAIDAAIIFLPALLQTLALAQGTAVSAVLSLAAATLIAALILSPSGSLSAVAAILPPLAVLLTGQWPPSAQRTRNAVLTVAGGTMLAWTYALAGRAFAHA
jgi:hypothetical protein